MWKGKTVSVIFPTYNEKDSIYASIQDFFGSGYVDEIVVVNNNAQEGTDQEVLKTAARLCHEKRQGYGYAIQRGFQEVTGEIVVVSEPDGTFVGKDALKLLAYSDDFEVVFGTRTLHVMIWEGANMGWFLRLGNYLAAKLIEVLFNTTSLSDVGCTMRLIHRDSLEKMKGRFTIGGSAFGLEMILIAIENKLRFIQIPVNYMERVGTSSVTGSRIKAFLLGMYMIWLIITRRIKSLLFV